MVSRFFFMLMGIFVLIVREGKSWALGGEFLPASAQPEQVSKALSEELPVAAPARAPALTAPEEGLPSPLGEEAKKIKFKLNDIVLSGNTVYSGKELRLLYQNKLNKTLSVPELFEIIQAITNYYRNNGYILSRAILPPQHVKGGIVHVRIIEGYISGVEISGDPKGAK